MVVTKSEEMATQLTGLTAAIADLNTNLTAKMDDQHKDLGERIGNIEGNITSQIQNLEAKFDAEINALKATNVTFSHRIENFATNANAQIGVLRTETNERFEALEQTDKQYTEAVSIIEAQQKKIVSLEKSCHQGLQHGRGFNVEIDGFPVNIGDDPQQLEDAAMTLLTAINVDLNRWDIDTIHRLRSKKSPKPVIIRFVSRKTVRDIHDNKNKLKYLADLNLDIPGITDDSSIFIRASQCSYYKNLAFNCRLLKRNGLVSRVYTGKDGRVSIKKPDGTNLNITHETDLTSNFAEFQGFNFNYDDHEVAEENAD